MAGCGLDWFRIVVNCSRVLRTTKHRLFRPSLLFMKRGVQQHRNRNTTESKASAHSRNSITRANSSLVKFLFIAFVTGYVLFYSDINIMGNSGTKLPSLQATTKAIDNAKVMGKWYVISCIPTVFEKGAHNAVENYEWKNEAKQELKVTFTYQTGGFDKPVSKMTQDGYVYNKETGSEWRVRPRFFNDRVPVPFWLPYIILAGPSTEKPDVPLIVGYPDRSYLWIMHRTPKMDDAEYDAIVKRCKDEWQYNTDLIYKVPNNFEA
jgi:apolipoprotein D and lipocalin family protein